MLKKIKSLFFVEEEVAPSEPKGPGPLNQNQRAGDKELMETMKKAGVDRNSMDQFFIVLAEAMENNNLKGYDYLEYKEGLKSLDKLEADESRKFVTAFALAQTMGAHKESLINSANHYLEILGQEDAKFQNSLQKQIEEKLNNGNKLIAEKEEQIGSRKATIQKLEEEIGILNTEMTKLKAEVNEAANKVATIKNSFMKAYQSITEQIKTDINKIEKYLN